MRPMTRRICEELAAEQGRGRGDAGAHPRGRGGGGDRDGRRRRCRGRRRPEARLVAPAREGAGHDGGLRPAPLPAGRRGRGAPGRRRGGHRRGRSSGSGRRRRRRRSAGSPEAWARLQTAPEFVREGIRKAAERRARRHGRAGDHLASPHPVPEPGHDEGGQANPRARLHRAHVRRLRRRQGRDPDRSA